MKTRILGIALIASAALAIQSCQPEAKPEDEQPVVKLNPLVTLEEAQLSDFTHKIRVQGDVETDQDITLSAEMGGLITSISVKEGQTVRKGQVIARVDASVLGANVQEIATQLEYAEYMLKKQKELMDRGVGSEFDLETAQSQVNSLKASMNSLNTQRGKAVVKAPFTGVVDEVFASNGQMAGPSAPIIRLVNNKNIDIVANISEKHFAKIKVGTPIEVSFPNYSDTVVDLKITNVGNYIEPTNRTFRIMSSIKNNSYFLPNMLAEVSITDMEVKDGLTISSKSILKDQNSNDYVYIASPQTGEGAKENHYTLTECQVEVIERYEGVSLIKMNQTLKAGDMIVVDGAKGVTAKDVVRVQAK